MSSRHSFSDAARSARDKTLLRVMEHQGMHTLRLLLPKLPQGTIDLAVRIRKETDAVDDKALKYESQSSPVGTSGKYLAWWTMGQDECCLETLW